MVLFSVKEMKKSDHLIENQHQFYLGFYSVIFNVEGTSTVVQWLRPYTPIQGAWVQSLTKDPKGHI